MTPSPRFFVESLEGRRLLSAAVLLTTNNQLVPFDTGSPSTIGTPVAITGLQTSETVVAIDFRPATGALYGIGSTSRLYLLDRTTGAATLVGTTFEVPLSGNSFDMDFNPVVDRIRVVSNTDQNLRINPNTGAVVDGDGVTAGVQGDTALAFDAADANTGEDPILGGAAYTNNFSGASATTLFGLDSGLNVLLTQGSANGAPTSPNAGTLFTVGSLNIDASKRVGFDIESKNGVDTGFAVLQVSGTARQSLYSVSLTTGAAGVVGRLGLDRRITDLAMVPQNYGIIAVSTRNELVLFASDTPGTERKTLAIKGLASGERIVGIDFRPATDELFGLSSDDMLYVINPGNGRATAVGSAFLLSLGGDSYGFDFNPVPDRIRVVANSAQNLRLNPDTGAVVDTDLITAGVQIDTNVAFDAGDVNAGTGPSIVGSAYTNSFAGATATTLFGIDANLNALVRQGSAGGSPVSPNAGTLFTVGALGVDIVKRLGFDMVTLNGVNKAFAVMQVSGESTAGFYEINLTSGAATLIGAAPAGRQFSGMTIRPV